MAGLREEIADSVEQVIAVLECGEGNTLSNLERYSFRPFLAWIIYQRKLCTYSFYALRTHTGNFARFFVKVIQLSS